MWCDLSFLKKFGWRRRLLFRAFVGEKIKFSIWFQKKSSLEFLHSRIKEKVYNKYYGQSKRYN